MKLYKRHIFFGIIFLNLILSSIIFSQEPPIRWGEIPRADLEMKSFPQDTNASAVILCDFGESSFDDDLNIIYKRHLRVKILSTKGYEWGTHSLTIYTENGTERIYDIEGMVYSLDDNNTIAKKELDKDEVFKEDVDGKRTRYRFTLPGLKPGCVIEIRYTIESKSLWFIKDWVFQHSEPVRWSEYRIQSPKAIAYSAVTNGYEPFTVRETRDVTQIFSGRATSYLGNTIVPCTQMRWAVQNIPALRDEPFITTIDDYVDKVDVQLAGYAFVGGGVKHVMNTWSSLIEELLNSEYFLKKIDDTRHIRKQAEEITLGLSMPEDKLKAIYNWVARSIVWSGDNRLFANQEADDVLESKKGSNSEITFLFLSLLKSVGINGDPVILSTRSNGKIQNLYPILSQFNYVLAKVSLGSQNYYLDATDPLRPMDLLPRKVLNVKGLVIKKENPEWVTLTAQKQYINTSLALINLHEDGSLDGTLEDIYRDYAGVFQRRDLKDKKDIDVAKESFETEQAGITIDSVLVEAKDSINLPLKLKVKISSPVYAQSNGDLIYINPQILHRNRDNPFKEQSRKFPIDYSYQRSNTTEIILSLPDNFAIKEPFGNRSYSVGADLVSYFRNVQVDSHKVIIITKLEIHDVEIKPKYYEQLQEFYSQIVSAESEQLVLARIKKPVVPLLDVKTSKKKGKK